ncbi:transcription elongation factor GreA [Robbsia sp. KACC 23696]|uniref:transcription elongation factor GreA n=1 Tax=Robbsia sp. KACC 23696 TaxID=3149231 RepID=UPI00325C132C
MDLGDGRDYADYVNVPRTIGTVISSGKATLAELETVLGMEDVYDLLEIIAIDAYNKQIASRAEG